METMLLLLTLYVNLNQELMIPRDTIILNGRPYIALDKVKPGINDTLITVNDTTENGDIIPTQFITPK